MKLSMIVSGKSSLHKREPDKMWKKLIFLLLTASHCHAGFYALTHHSRANCVGFNETITWWAGHSVLSRVISDHYPNGKALPKSGVFHRIDSGKNNTWRHAAYHAKEAYSGNEYRVRGYHYMYIKGNPALVQQDDVVDCSIYDGWWD